MAQTLTRLVNFPQAGRAFFLSSFSLMVGYAFILYHDLEMKFENVPTRMGQARAKSPLLI